MTDSTDINLQHPVNILSVYKNLISRPRGYSVLVFYVLVDIRFGLLIRKLILLSLNNADGYFKILS